MTVPESGAPLRGAFEAPADPELMFENAPVAAAFARLRPAVAAGTALAVLTGEPGMGKTTLLHRLMAELERAGLRCVACQLPIADLDDLRARLPASEPGRRMAVGVDEAHGLTTDVLRSLQGLLGERRDVGMILVGERGLERTLEALNSGGPGVPPVVQCRLVPFARGEVGPYMRYRWERAGAGPFPFAAPAVARLAEISGGIPRVINLLASRALWLSDVLGRGEVSAELVDSAARDLAQGNADRPASPRRRLAPVAAAAVLALTVGSLALLRYSTSGRDTPVAPSQTVPSTSRATAPLSAVQEPPVASPPVAPEPPVTSPPTAQDLPVVSPLVAPQAPVTPPPVAQQPRTGSPPVAQDSSLTPPRVAQERQVTSPVAPQPRSASPPLPSPPDSQSRAASPPIARVEPRVAEAPEASAALPVDPSRRETARGQAVAPPSSAAPREARTPVKVAAATPQPLGAPIAVAPSSAAEKNETLLARAEDGDVDAVRALLAAGAQPGARDASGFTPLMLAVVHGQSAMVDVLLARGADVNARNRAGLTPVMLASINDRVPVLRALLARGADVNARTRAGWTALTYAAWRGHAAVARVLIAHGAQPNVTDRDGRTILQYATLGAAESTVDDDVIDRLDGGAARAEAARRHAEVIALLRQVGVTR